MTFFKKKKEKEKRRCLRAVVVKGFGGFSLRLGSLESNFVLVFSLNSFFSFSYFLKSSDVKEEKNISFAYLK